MAEHIVLRGMCVSNRQWPIWRSYGRIPGVELWASGSQRGGGAVFRRRVCLVLSFLPGFPGKAVPQVGQETSKETYYQAGNFINY